MSTDLQRASLVLTYTFIDASNRDEVMRFYGQPSAGNSIEKLNETSTDKEGAPDRLDFRLKLTHLWKGKIKNLLKQAGDTHSRASSFLND